MQLAAVKITEGAEKPSPLDSRCTIPLSPMVRLEGRHVRRCLPAFCEFFASCGLHPSFVYLAALSLDPRSEPRSAVPWCTTVQAANAALPQGSSLQAGL
jgi:hypothetical protein